MVELQPSIGVVVVEGIADAQMLENIDLSTGHGNQENEDSPPHILLRETEQNAVKSEHYAREAQHLMKCEPLLPQLAKE